MFEIKNEIGVNRQFHRDNIYLEIRRIAVGINLRPDNRISDRMMRTSSLPKFVEKFSFHEILCMIRTRVLAKVMLRLI